MEIIPAIDIMDGKCVRLVQGDYAQQTLYHQRPLEVAKQFEGAGLRRLHLVDLDGARAGAVQNWKVLETIAGKTSLIIDFGGGIKTGDDVRVAFDSGASLAVVGSIAVSQEDLFLQWILVHGAEKFLLGADVKEEKIAVHGWQEQTSIGVYDFIEKYLRHGIRQIFCTDIDRDGKLEGPAAELYERILKKFPDLYFTASGGISSLNDLETLQQLGCKGAIIGKAIYEDRIKLTDLKSFL
jgi:phosphoribosylformimino-5-aminoimidazole carboxamide ribotide isomerase